MMVCNHDTKQWLSGHVPVVRNVFTACVHSRGPKHRCVPPPCTRPVYPSAWAVYMSCKPCTWAGTRAMYGRCTWAAFTGAWNTLSVFTARKRAPSLRATFTAHHHRYYVPSLTLPTAESISPAIGKFGLKMPIHTPAECRQHAHCPGMSFPLKVAPLQGDLDSHLIDTSLGTSKSKSQTASRSVQPFLHSSRQTVPILYNGRPFPQKLPLPTGRSGPHLIHDSLGPSEPTTQTASRSVQLFLHGPLM